MSKVNVAMLKKRDLFYFTLCIDVIKRSKVKRVTRGQGQRSGSKVKVTINVKEKAVGLTPTSSCFIHLVIVYFCFSPEIAFRSHI